MLGIATVLLCVFSLRVAQNTQPLLGYLVKPATTVPWKVITATDVQTGAIIPPNTHVIFHLPDNFTSIARETLLGQKGETTRYWGYCFPQNYDPALVEKRSGFPGLLFLSEKERVMRRAEEAQTTVTFSPMNLPSDKEIAAMNTFQKSSIRHQYEIFKPSTMCYIMSERSLSIGLDGDDDLLNTKLERELGTDVQITDTDGDGIGDGIEYMYSTIPTQRDTDGDNIIDGIEDANWNGRISSDETDPRVQDSDRDGLCDGVCRVKFGKNWLYIGEDKNLNGEVDDGETDPRTNDTDDDGVYDDWETYQCLANGKAPEECP